MNIIENFVQLKKEFVKLYTRNAHIQEIIPNDTANFPIDEKHLELLHNFAQKNPIYHRKKQSRNLKIIKILIKFY